MKSTPAQNVDQYIQSFPEHIQHMLEDVRKTIRNAAPEAEESPPTCLMEILYILLRSKVISDFIPHLVV